MTKVIIQEKFNTSMGLILKVKNDRLFKVNDNIETEEGEFKIKQIKFSSNPDEFGYVNLIVKELKAS